jgi:membrane-associated phospholipid phosphatase
MANVGRHVNSSVYNRTYSVVGDSNPVAAMPSLHEAITFMVFLFALNGGWKIGVPAFIYAIAMAFALVYTGEHYVIDTVIGAAIATYAYVYSGRWLNITAPVFGRMSRNQLQLDAETSAGSD